MDELKLVPGNAERFGGFGWYIRGGWCGIVSGGRGRDAMVCVRSPAAGKVPLPMKTLISFALVTAMAVPMLAQTTTTAPGTQTTTTTTAAPMTKSEMKAQKKQQKAQEKAAKENAKAASEQSKALKHQDKATNAAEKAGSSAPATPPPAL